MNRSISILATAVALTIAAQSSFAADVQVKVPSTPDAVRSADLIARAERALVAYVSSCSTRDHAGVEHTVTPDAVFEYALDDSPNYLAITADSLIGDCWSAVPTLATGERIQTLWIFPTGTANTVFVHYTASAPGETNTSEHLAFIEMRGPRIAKLHDFTHPSEKIAGDFFDTAPDSRRQKASFLPPATSRSYALSVGAGKSGS